MRPPWIILYLLAHHVPQMLDWIKIWDAWRMSQHLRLIVVLLKLSMEQFSTLLKEATAIRDTVSVKGWTWVWKQSWMAIGGLQSAHTPSLISGTKVWCTTYCESFLSEPALTFAVAPSFASEYQSTRLSHFSPWPPMSPSSVHHGSFLGPLLIDCHHCTAARCNVWKCFLSLKQFCTQ